MPVIVLRLKTVYSIIAYTVYCPAGRTPFQQRQNFFSKVLFREHIFILRGSWVVFQRQWEGPEDAAGLVGGCGGGRASRPGGGPVQPLPLRSQHSVWRQSCWCRRLQVSILHSTYTRRVRKEMSSVLDDLIAPSCMSPNAVGGGCRVSANEYSCAARSPNKL
jgi:hypothetical protein